MKKSTVEWLVDQIENDSDTIFYGRNLHPFEKYVEQAKEMEKKEKLVRQLFIGKVSEIIGFDKTLELLKESKQTIEKI